MARLYDMHFQTIPPAQLQGLKVFTFGQKRSLGIAGLRKLVNMFLKYLMTPVGTDPLDLDVGTELPLLIGSNIGVHDAKEILLLSVDKASRAIITLQSGQAPPDDEALAGVSVTDYLIISDSGFSAQLYLKNVAGAGLQFLLPTLTVSQ
jgi:hypothetical protein